MFQIANCIAHAMRYGFEYKIPESTADNKKWPVYFTHFPKLDIDFDHFGTYREQHHGYTPIPRKEQICFDGYFQSYKYWWQYKNQIIDAFAPAFSFVEDKGIDYSNKVAIHVRRTDYVELGSMHPPVTIEYLQKAINHFKELGLTSFTIYSDDMRWCKEIFSESFVPGCEYVFMEVGAGIPEKYALFDLYTMSRHNHQIISNSTFSLFASFMNEHKDKIIVSPHEDNWFGPEYSSLSTNDILPNDYIRIKF
jgi:hypothetical protein